MHYVSAGLQFSVASFILDIAVTFVRKLKVLSINVGRIYIYRKQNVSTNHNIRTLLFSFGLTPLLSPLESINICLLL
jgi:hypothetical protein